MQSEKSLSNLDFIGSRYVDWIYARHRRRGKKFSSLDEQKLPIHSQAGFCWVPMKWDVRTGTRFESKMLEIIRLQGRLT